MSTAKTIVLAVIGGVVGLGAIIGVLVWLFMFEPVSNIITEEQAKEIALTHAEVDDAATKMYTVKFDKEALDSNYDIEFYVGNAKYKYEINAKTGGIDDFDVDGLREQIVPQTEDRPAEVQIESQSEVPTKVTVAEAKISEGEAVKILAQKIPGLQDSNIWIKLDMEDGRLVYEGEIIQDGMEYEFEIDANDGTILSWETERAEADDIPRESNYTEKQHHVDNHNKNNQ
jgi:Predicted membrane protein